MDQFFLYLFPVPDPCRKKIRIRKHYKNVFGRPVVDVVLSSILLVDGPLIVVVHHPVDTQDVGLVLPHRPLWLQDERVPPCRDTQVNTVSRVLADFAVYDWRCYIAKLNVTKSLVNWREMVENLAT